MSPDFFDLLEVADGDRLLLPGIKAESWRRFSGADGRGDGLIERHVHIGIRRAGEEKPKTHDGILGEREEGVNPLCLTSFPLSVMLRPGMAIERTLALIKPDATGKNIVGEIIRRYEEAQLKVVAMKMLQMTKTQAEEFYAVHRREPFFNNLTDFIASGRVVALVLEGEGAISRLRDLMGATDPKKAAAGTIRESFGASIDQNVVHGSDSVESAKFEIPFFFSAFEVFG